MADKYGGAFMIMEVPRNPDPENIFDIGGMADLLRAPDQDKRKVSDKLRWFLSQGYIKPAAKETEGKKAYLFNLGQVMVADILLRMAEMGIANPDAANAVSRTLTYWMDTDKPEGAAGNPAAHVIAEFGAGVSGWTFELWTYAHTHSGRVRFAGRIAHEESGQRTGLTPSKDEDYRPRGFIVLPFADLLDRVHPDNRAKRKGMN